MQQIGRSVWEIVSQAVFLVLKMVYKGMGKELTNETVSAFLQFIKFGIVGVSNTVIHYGIYMISLAGFRAAGLLAEADYLAAQVIAFILSVLWSFYWNHKMVFRPQEGTQRSLWKSLLKTYISYSFTGLFLNTLLLLLLVQVLHISEFIAPVINLIINVPINFLINKFWAFK